MFVMHDILTWIITDAGVLTIVASILEGYYTSPLPPLDVKTYLMERWPLNEVIICLMAISCFADKLIYALNKVAKYGPNPQEGDTTISTDDDVLLYDPYFNQYSQFQIWIYQFNVGFDLFVYVCLFGFTIKYMLFNRTIAKKLKARSVKADQASANPRALPPRVLSNISKNAMSLRKLHDVIDEASPLPDIPRTVRTIKASGSILPQRRILVTPRKRPLP